MSHTGINEKLSSLEHRYSESIHCALSMNDHAAAQRLGSSYDAKARRLRMLRDARLSPLRRVALQTLIRLG